MKPYFVPLKGKSKFKRLLKDTQGLKAGLVVLKPHQAIGLHSTEEKREIIIVLEGKARVYYGRRKTFTLKDKAFVFLPAHTIHNVENIGKGLLRYVYITI